MNIPASDPQMMRERMEAMSHFAGDIGLRLGKYLMTVLGESNYLLGHHPPGDKSRPWIEQIKSAAGVAAQLTQQLITFSCRLPPDVQLISLHTVVKELAEKFTTLFSTGMARGDFRVDIQLDSQDALVLVDAPQLENAIVRLMKWTQQRLGTATLILRTSASPDNPDSVRLTLADDGPALSADDQAHLFEPFHNIEADMPDLGLALAYGIIQQAGGKIDLASNAQGTTIHIDLPLAKTETVSPTATPAATKATVLVVDDEELVLNYLVIALQHLGYEVIQSKDGNEALYHCMQSNQNIDVLLTDMILPGMNGRQLAEQAKKLRPQLKFVFMSGYTENLLGEGRVFLRKPVMPDLLGNAIRHVLSAPRDSLSKALSSTEINVYNS